jgi:hypothetical protein
MSGIPEEGDEILAPLPMLAKNGSSISAQRVGRSLLGLTELVHVLEQIDKGK